MEEERDGVAIEIALILGVGGRMIEALRRRGFSDEEIIDIVSEKKNPSLEEAVDFITERNYPVKSRRSRRKS